MRLGKKPYVHDEKTLKLASSFSPTVVVPKRYDFDSHRAHFPLSPWGNDAWGNCVKVAQANHVIRLERLELRRTIPITEEVVVEAYKEESKREFGTSPATPGDQYDDGLIILENLRNWRKIGFGMGNRAYNICAFGELEPNEPDQLKAAVYLLHGVQFGFALPLATRQMTANGLWDIPAGATGPEWKPGSWGGHAVYSKAYDDDVFEVISWGQKVKVSSRFIQRYADECWAVVDDFDHWRKRPEIDVSSIIQHLQDIGASNIER